MERIKLKITLSLAVLIPCVLYIAGIIAQFMININAWKAAGSDYSVSPGLPSLELADVFRSIFHFPEGLIAIGVVVVGIVLICIFGLRIGWGQNGVTDADRNLTVSNSGSYGTASFMSPKEASACFDVTSAKKTEQDILGMLPDTPHKWRAEKPICKLEVPSLHPSHITVEFFITSHVAKKKRNILCDRFT